MKGILSQKNKALVLEIESNEKRKILIEDKEIESVLQKTAETLEFENALSMCREARKGDGAIFEFERMYDIDESFSFELLDSYLEGFKVDRNLGNVLKKELRINYINDLAASAIECIFDNFAYVIIDQMNQLLLNELEIEVKSFDNEIYARLIEILGSAAGIAQITVKLKNNGEKN
ncbi:hypothetical protein JW978_03755 [Candidatus Dojkabacteria bacterium]|nr:hypothetical protein [Candidatus Dojkabacteria bacterium]